MEHEPYCVSIERGNEVAISTNVGTSAIQELFDFLD